MRAGGGKGKGSSFERWVCKKLSLWITKGNNTDVFWRSAMSGGRATVKQRQGGSNRQSGDIVSVSPEGHKLTDAFFIECKFVKNLSIASFLLENVGPLAQFWTVAQAEAAKYGKLPLIIAKQNRGPVIMITPMIAATWTRPILMSYPRNCDISLFEEVVFYETTRRRRSL